MADFSQLCQLYVLIFREEVLIGSMPPALRKLLEFSRLKQVQKGQVLLYAGDALSEILVIKTGVVKLYNIDEQGNEKILHLLRPLMTVPLAFFSRPETPPRWDYAALTNCDLYAVPRHELQKLIETDAWSMRFLVNAFSEEVHEILTRLESLGKSDSGTKITSALLYLVVCHGQKIKGGWWRILFPVNHQLIADMTGVTRETVSLAMKSLGDSKIIRNPRLAQLEINFDRLQNYRQFSTQNNIAS